jgi:hypothetical protein
MPTQQYVSDGTQWVFQVAAHWKINKYWQANGGKNPNGDHWPNGGASGHVTTSKLALPSEQALVLEYTHWDTDVQLVPPPLLGVTRFS